MMKNQTKPRTPKIIRFSLEEKEEFQILIDSEKFMDNLYTEVINAIEDGINNDLDEIKIFKIYDFNCTVTAKKEHFNSLLDKAIEFYADKEDYDICQIIKKIKQ
jgi:hypothetical protein